VHRPVEVRPAKLDGAVAVVLDVLDCAIARLHEPEYRPVVLTSPQPTIDIRTAM